MNHKVTIRTQHRKIRRDVLLDQPSDWPYMDAKAVTQIRCFLPGAGT
jgi:hypothetical protein